MNNRTFDPQQIQSAQQTAGQTGITPSISTIPKVKPFGSKGLRDGQIGLKPSRNGIKPLSMTIALGISTGIHLLVPATMLAGLVIALLVMGIDVPEFFKKHTEPKIRDLEFVLTPPNTPDLKPLNPNTTNRARQNTRASGKRDPNQIVHISEHPQSAKSGQARAVKPVQAKLVSKVKPVAADPNAAIQQQQTSTATEETDGYMISSMSEMESNGDGTTESDNPTVDALKEPDFGPYMTDLQKRIKQSWQPPRGKESKKVIVSFKVGRDGKLLDADVEKSSGSPEADAAAIEAVKRTFPFRPLPSEFKESDIDIEFTFDYNVFGDKQRLGNFSDKG